jgi:hypothetical protein
MAGFTTPGARMSKKNPLPFPLSLLLLDFIGALLFALGLVESSNPGSLWPTDWAFPGFTWLCFILGGLLMLPMVLHMVGKARQQAAAAEAPSRENRKPTVDRR